MKNKDLKRDIEEIDGIDETNKRLNEKIQGLINEINEQKWNSVGSLINQSSGVSKGWDLAQIRPLGN